MHKLLSRIRDHIIPSENTRISTAIERVRDRAAQLKKYDTPKLIALSLQTRTLLSAHRGRSYEKYRDVWGTVFALIAEAVRRTTGKTFYDVQLHGGIELARGRVAQMQTGEGKTLTTALPAFLRALQDGSVHVATTNAYLAQRDYEELRPAFELLGLSVGLLPDEHDEAAKREAYRCDITFGTGYEFGFDFLRDQMAFRARGAVELGAEHLLQLAGGSKRAYEPLQGKHAFAIVDEADSVLIDEATMPLILSSSMPAINSALSLASNPFCANDDGVPTQVYELADRVAQAVIDADEYELSRTEGRLEIDKAGWVRAYEALHDSNSLPLSRHWSIYVENAMRARLMFDREVDYVVIDDTVQIVDQHTGRIHEERTWRDGLHQAVEVRENVTVTPESGSDARITRQRYFRQYQDMAGMTGTAQGVEEELKNFYGLEVSVIPTHRPNQRRTLPLRCFVDDSCRNAAIASDVAELRKSQRPVLVGTRTIRHSRELSERFEQLGISHTLLNGLQDESEAAIISQAGREGAVTIATNMAGRGTDIGLNTKVKELGGLHVIGAEMNLSHRVDRQLAGRAARQGDPGSCQFYVSADDELISTDNDLRVRMMIDLGEDGECRSDFTRDAVKQQRKMEQRGFESRRAMVARDHWLDEVLKTLAGRGRSNEL